MVKIQAVIPVWRRPEIVRVCAEMMPDWVDPIWVLSMEDPDIKEILSILGVNYFIFAKNDNLSAKHNTAYKHLQWFDDYDYVMGMNSDTVIHPEYRAIVDEQTGMNTDVFGMGAVDVMKWDTGEGAEWWLPRDAPEVFGAGRCISRRVIQALKGEIYPDNLDRGLDTASQKRIKAAGFEVTKILPESGRGMILDIKNEYNINPWELVTNRLDDKHKLSREHIQQRYGIYNHSI